MDIRRSEWMMLKRRKRGKGPQGEEGETGLVGLKGDKGDTGSQGDIGLTGPTGATGSTGATGPKGDKGDKGDTGNTGSPGTNGTNGTNATPTQSEILTISSGTTTGRVTWTYPTPYGSGIVPHIGCVAVKPTSGFAGSINIQLYGDPTNTSCVFELNTISPSVTLSSVLTTLLGSVLTIFNPTISGIKLHCYAKAP